MKRKSCLLNFMIMAFLLIATGTSIKAENLIIGESGPDTLTVNGKGFDTIVVKNNSLLISRNLRLNGTMILESGGKFLGDPFCWFGQASDTGTVIINNSGPDAFEDIQVTLYRDVINKFKGQYPITVERLFAGWSPRDIKLETELTVDGPFFNGNDTKVYTNGQTVTLTPNTYFEGTSPSQTPLVVQDAAKIKYKINSDVTNISIPVGDDYHGDIIRTNIVVEVNDGAVLGSNPEIILQVLADSFHVNAAGSSAQMIDRFLNLEFNDVTTPDFDVSLEYGSADIIDGDINSFYSAFWNGSEWNYGGKVDVDNNIIKFNVTEEGTLTAGKNLGLDEDYCYSPTELYFNGISNNSAIVNFDEIDGAEYYVVNYREDGQTAWVSDTTTSNSYNINELDSAGVYELAVSTVCQEGVDTSELSDIIGFYTAVEGYDSATNILNVDTYDTIPSFIRYSKIEVNNGGTAVLTSDVHYIDYLNVYDGGALFLDEHHIISADGLAQVRRGATIRYGSVYAYNKNSKYNAAIQPRAGKIWDDIDIILNGKTAGIEGQIIDDNMPSGCNNLILNGNQVVNRIPSGVFIVEGKFELNSGNFLGRGGSTTEFACDTVEINVDSAFIDASIRIKTDTVLFTGASDYVRVNEIEVREGASLSSLVMDMDVKTSELKLNNGEIKINDNALIVDKISDDPVGAIISEDSGVFKHRVNDFSEIVFPFGKGADTTMLPVKFNLVSGDYTDDDSYVAMSLKDSVAPNLDQSVLVDYISRYLDVSFDNMNVESYNISMTYDSIYDIFGDEAFMQAHILSEGEWTNSYTCIDTINNEIYINGLGKSGILTAGNYLAYDSAQAINLRSYDVTTTAATLAWEFWDLGVNEWKVYYKKSSGAWQGPVNITDTNSTRITGLDTGSDYQWYVATDQTAGYPWIKNSDTVSFTTGGACDQPIELVVDNNNETSITVSWEEGVADYVVEYQRKDSLDWNTTSLLSDTSYEIQGLNEMSVYTIRVKSSCGTYSDSIIANTSVPGWDENNNILYVTDTIDIPVDFTFDKIIIDSLGFGTLVGNIKVNDSLIVKKHGSLNADIYEVEGFSFNLSDTAYLLSAHKNCFSKADEDYSDSGFVKTNVRNLGQHAYYEFNGTVSQTMYPFLNEKKGKYSYVKFNNPASVTLPDLEVTFNRKLEIMSGKILLQEKQDIINLGTNARFYNYSVTDALNNGDLELRVSGGPATDTNLAEILGPNPVEVKILSISGYKQPKIKADVIVSEILDISVNTYTDGFSVFEGATISLKPEAVIEFGKYDDNFLGLYDGAVLRQYYNETDTAERFYPLGFPSPIGKSKFDVNFELASASLGGNSYVDFQISNDAHPEIDTLNYLKPYISLNGSDISDFNYDLQLSTSRDNFVGKDSLLTVNIFNNSQWDSSYIDSVVYADTLLNVEGFIYDVDVWGDIALFQKSGDNSINNLSGENSLLSVYPNPATDKIYISSDKNNEISDLEINVLDALGKNVLSKTFFDSSEYIDVSSLNSGMYFVIISNGEESHVSKLLIK